MYVCVCCVYVCCVCMFRVHQVLVGTVVERSDLGGRDLPPEEKRPRRRSIISKAYRRVL